MEDAELILRIQNGETEYMDCLISRHYDSIGKYCFWKTRSVEAAEDITQETFYRFFRYFDQYSHVGKCRAYLYTIARRLCSEFFSIQQSVSMEELTETSGFTLSMEEEVESEHSVNQMISKLPPDQQEVMLLRFIHDFKYRDIASITGLSIYMVQHKVKKSLSFIKKDIERGSLLEQTPDKHNPRPSAATSFTPY